MEWLGKLQTVQKDFIRWVKGFTRQVRVSASKLRKDLSIVTIEDHVCVEGERSGWQSYRLCRMTLSDGSKALQGKLE